MVVGLWLDVNLLTVDLLDFRQGLWLLLDNLKQRQNLLASDGPLYHLVDVYSFLLGKCLIHQQYYLVLFGFFPYSHDLVTRRAGRQEQKLQICFGQAVQIVEIVDVKDEFDFVLEFAVLGEEYEPRKQLQPIDEQIVIVVKHPEDREMIAKYLDELRLVDSEGIAEVLELAV